MRTLRNVVFACVGLNALVLLMVIIRRQFDADAEAILTIVATVMWSAGPSILGAGLMDGPFGARQGIVGAILTFAAIGLSVISYIGELEPRGVGGVNFGMIFHPAEAWLLMLVGAAALFFLEGRARHPS